jgi:hypothetical protein
VMEEAASERERRHEDRQYGDQTHTHTSPLRRGTHYSLTNNLYWNHIPKQNWWRNCHSLPG